MSWLLPAGSNNRGYLGNQSVYHVKAFSIQKTLLIMPKSDQHILPYHFLAPPHPHLCFFCILAISLELLHWFPYFLSHSKTLRKRFQMVYRSIEFRGTIVTLFVFSCWFRLFRYLKCIFMSSAQTHAMWSASESPKRYPPAKSGTHCWFSHLRPQDTLPPSPAF